jgi:hypothetical protein
LFGFSADEKYQHYLDWFTNEVSDPNKWAQMRFDKDCSNYNDNDCAPIPYERGEALFRMGNPKKMSKAMKKYQAKTKAKIDESYQYVGGNPANGKLNSEYIKNDQVLQETRKRLKVYTGSTEAASDELFRIARLAEIEGKNITEVLDQEVKKMDGKPLQPEPPAPPDSQWVPLSAWEAFKHWMKGGEVDKEPQHTDWRDAVGIKDESKR